MNFDAFGPQQGWGTFWEIQRGRTFLQHYEKSMESMKFNQQIYQTLWKIYGIDEIQSKNLLNTVKNIRDWRNSIKKSTKHCEKSTELTEFNQQIY